jgi:YidC/Oxa1 family membrane protein insertase
MLTTALFLLWMNMVRNPPPAPNAANNNPPPVANENQDPLLRDNPGAGAVAEKPAAEITKLDDDLADEQIVVLGSMNAKKNFNLQVTLTTRGAGLLRAEAVEQKKPGRFKYRALEHDGGYLGYLALRPHSTGARILSVPDGSPAASATCPTVAGGLVADDVLIDIEGKPITSENALQLALAKTKPGETVSVAVERTTAGIPQTLQFKAVLVEAPLDILRTEEFLSEYVPGNIERASFLTSLASLNGTRIPTGKDVLPVLSGTLKANWSMQPLAVEGGEGVEFRLPLDGFLEATGRPKQIDLVKRYRLLPKSNASDGYVLDLETVIVNRNEQSIDVSFRQQGVAGLTLEGWWYSVKISPHMFSAAGQRDVIYSTFGSGHNIIPTRTIVDYAKKTPALPDKLLFSESEPEAMRSLKYIGLDAQYFNASIQAHPESADALTNLRQSGSTAVANVDALNKYQLQAANVSFWFETMDKKVEPGTELKQRYSIFIGPKDSTILASHGLDSAIEYGWPIFYAAALPLSWILHAFYAVVRNYGIAIIMLTVLVRGSMFPLGRKAALNAQKMQELQPELKKINDLYKDNMEKRGKAMQELYKKHNFQPLAGCLPLFIQLPVFIGLYRCLSVDISLRQEPLFPGLAWCSNLAGPDMLADWSSWMPEIIAGRGPGWFGPYFNILPLVTVALFLIQQKVLMPKATDEQTQMTQNMMQIMTIFMGVMFFKVPSGLCIYFITSSIWSLVERKLVKHLLPPKPTTTVIETKEEKKPEDNRRSVQREQAPEKTGAKSRFEELRAMLDKPAVRSSTQRGSNKDKKRRK